MAARHGDVFGTAPSRALRWRHVAYDPVSEPRDDQFGHYESVVDREAGDGGQWRQADVELRHDEIGDEENDERRDAAQDPTDGSHRVEDRGLGGAEPERRDRGEGRAENQYDGDDLKRDRRALQ